MVGGQAGISGHIKIGNQVKVGGHSGVTSSVQDGKAVMGYPSFEHTQFARATVVFKKLPEIYREMDALKKEIESLKQQLATGKA
jgi:UDP-3-O-[3-hydroxymyristoyl] glucosamine N-acyltransferase